MSQPRASQELRRSQPGAILVNPEASGAGQTADEINRTGLKKGIITLEVATYTLTHTREDRCYCERSVVQPSVYQPCLVDNSLVYWLKLINKQLETVQQEVQYALHARLATDRSQQHPNEDMFKNQFNTIRLSYYLLGKASIHQTRRPSSHSRIPMRR